MISDTPVIVYYSNPTKAEVGLVAYSNASSIDMDVEFPIPHLTANQPHIESESPKVSVSENNSEIPDVIEWNSRLEAKFNRLAEKRALNQLSLAATIEFEKLSSQRRHLKNPRTGEEIVTEYEQRMITRELVQTLAKYVRWHKQNSANNSR